MNMSQRIDLFTETLWRWFPAYKRTLPWRDLIIEDPHERAYRILVSEIMLQQTQVNRVKIVYKDFLERFPTMKSLAAAGNRDVILAWRGMGYNNRAIRLRDAARILSARDTPMSSMEDLIAVPGIGHYTAAAVRNFAFNIPTPCLDTNIRRILHRVFVGPEHADGTWKKNDAWLLSLAADILPSAVDPAKHASSDSVIPRDARNWHAALMDFGSLICTKRNPRFDACPLTKAGIMKAANTLSKSKVQSPKSKRTEPGRMIGTKFVPNRIIRGRIVEELRDAPNGLSIADVGSRVCIDWSPQEHESWLQAIIKELSLDAIIRTEKRRVMLRD